MAKSNRFCLTKNNYNDLEDALWRTDLSQHFKYWVVGREVGDMGTPHLQGYIEFENNQKLRITGCKGRLELIGFAGYHIEIAKGSAQQNITYCTKDNDFYEGGVRPQGQGKRTDLDIVCEAIKDGDSMHELIQKYPSQVVKFRNGLEFLIQAQQPKRQWKTEVYWLHGPTGSGKSRWAWSEEPTAYSKASNHKWWSGYIGQDSVIIDDFRPCKEMPFNFILNLFDRYPLSVETKGGMVEFVARKIYVTSPYSLEETLRDMGWLGMERADQLRRRVEHVIQFPQLAVMFLPPVVIDLSQEV